MGTPVHPVDDKMQPVAQFVACQPLGEHPSDDRLGDPLAVHGVLSGTALISEAAVGERAVHGLDDVVPLAQRLQGRLGLLGDGPAPRLDLGGEVVAFQPLRAVDQQMSVGPNRVALGYVRPQVHDAALLLLGNQRPVEPGQPLRLHLLAEFVLKVDLGLRPEFQRDQFACSVADAMGDVIPGDVEDAAIVEDAAHDDAGMGMAGVVVINGDPVELRVEIASHLPHQVAGETAQVVHLDGILGRDDEAELVAVLPAALNEGAAIRLILQCRIGAALLAVAGDAIAFEIAQMGVGRLADRAAHLQAA
jgi:hypothetical protein